MKNYKTKDHVLFWLLDKECRLYFWLFNFFFNAGMRVHNIGGMFFDLHQSVNKKYGDAYREYKGIKNKEGK